MKFIKKLNPLFRINEVKEAEAAEVFMVYWHIVTSTPSGSFWGKGRQVSKAFLLEEDAKAFADSLKRANNLLQNENNIEVEIIRQK